MIFFVFPILVLLGLLGGNWLYTRKRLSTAGAAVSACLVYLGTMLSAAAGGITGAVASVFFKGGHDASPMFTLAMIFGGVGLLIGASVLFFYIPRLLARAKSATIGALAIIVTPLTAMAAGNVLIAPVTLQAPSYVQISWIAAPLFFVIGCWGGWKLDQLERGNYAPKNPSPPEA